jgi:hypothetical protein
MSLVDQADAANGLRGGPPGAALVADGNDPASRLIRLLDSIARETDDGIALFESFAPTDVGRPLEAFDLPTRWGRLSVALRWHGERPALLWEIDEWEDARPFGSVSLCAPALDPSWRASGTSGDSLLRV